MDLNNCSILSMPGISFIFLKIEVASSKSSLSLIEPSFILLSNFELILLTKFIKLPGFLNNFLNTSLTSVTFSISISKSFVVSSANSFAKDPIFPLISPLICEKILSVSGKLPGNAFDISLVEGKFIDSNIFSKSNGNLGSFESSFSFESSSFDSFESSSVF